MQVHSAKRKISHLRGFGEHLAFKTSLGSPVRSTSTFSHCDWSLRYGISVGSSFSLLKPSYCSRAGVGKASWELRSDRPSSGEPGHNLGSEIRVLRSENSVISADRGCDSDKVESEDTRECVADSVANEVFVHADETLLRLPHNLCPREVLPPASSLLLLWPIMSGFAIAAVVASDTADVAGVDVDVRQSLGETGGVSPSVIAVLDFDDVPTGRFVSSMARSNEFSPAPHGVREHLSD